MTTVTTIDAPIHLQKRTFLLFCAAYNLIQFKWLQIFTVLMTPSKAENKMTHFQH